MEQLPGKEKRLFPVALPSSYPTITTTHAYIRFCFFLLDLLSGFGLIENVLIMTDFWTLPWLCNWFSKLCLFALAKTNRQQFKFEFWGILNTKVLSSTFP